MRILSVVSIALLSLVFSSAVMAQDRPEFFWSFKGLGEGATNSDAAGAFKVGENVSAFLYFDPQHYDIDTGVFLDVTTTNSGVVDFTRSETFDFDITVQGIDIADRWGDGFGPGTVSGDGQETSFNAFNVVGGVGMIFQNTGVVFLDSGYDQDAAAFLFARVDFVARNVGVTEFNSNPFGNGICKSCNPFPQEFGRITITVVPEPVATFGCVLAFFVGTLRRNRCQA